MKSTKQEGLKVYGKWKLTARHIKTGKVIIHEGHNLIVTVGKELICMMLMDATSYDTGLTWCALGTDNTAPAVGQTELVNEGGGGPMRKEITSKSRAVNVLTFTTLFTAAESNIFIKEIAIFGHSTAGATENSGIMFARWLDSFDNSGELYDVSISYELTVG